jgi:hypothetical protein
VDLLARGACLCGRPGVQSADADETWRAGFCFMLLSGGESSRLRRGVDGSQVPKQAPQRRKIHMWPAAYVSYHCVKRTPYPHVPH